MTSRTTRREKMVENKREEKKKGEKRSITRGTDQRVQRPTRRDLDVSRRV